jgi:hypothetical protein
MMAALEVKPTLVDQIKQAQKGQKSIEGIKDRMKLEKLPGSQLILLAPYGTKVAYVFPLNLSLSSRSCLKLMTHLIPSIPEEPKCTKT